MLCPPDLALQVAASRELKLICCDTSKFYNDMGMSIEEKVWMTAEGAGG